MKRESDATARRTRGLRRRHSAEFKREVVEKTLQPNASVAAIALEHRLNTNLLFKWRRDHLRQRARLAPVPPTMLPVMVETSAVGADTSRQRVTASVIEIELPAGRIRLRGAVDVESLRAVVALLRQR
jgi:transposase